MADEFRVSVSTIKNWSKRFRWRERAENFDTWDRRALAQQTDEILRHQDEVQVKTLDRAIAKMIKLLADGKLRTRASDLRKLQALKDRPQKMIDDRTTGKKGGVPQARFLLPDNGRGHDEVETIPESQLDDYLEYLESYSARAAGDVGP